MAKLTQATIKELAEDYAAATLALGKAEAARERVLTPLIERQNAELAAATSKHDRKIDELETRANRAYSTVIDWLESQTKAVRIETEHAIAALRIDTITKTGPRYIDAKAFIAKAESQRKDPWTCITVAVGKAEKLLGPKDIAMVSERPETSVESRVAVLEVK